MKTCFVGDFSPTEVTNPLFAAGEVDILFEDTLALFAGNDANIVNVECALTEADTPIQKVGPNIEAALSRATGLTTALPTTSIARPTPTFGVPSSAPATTITIRKKRP